jgi:hypothetical protein
LPLEDKFVQFAFANVGQAMRLVELLYHAPGNLGTGRPGQLGQLVQRLFFRPAVPFTGVYSDQERFFLGRLGRIRSFRNIITSLNAWT